MSVPNIAIVFEYSTKFTVVISGIKYEQEFYYCDSHLQSIQTIIPNRKLIYQITTITETIFLFLHSKIVRINDSSSGLHTSDIVRDTSQIV